MICGTGSFKTLEDDLCSAPSTPREQKRKSTSKNNPYSLRGLDKFSTVVSELESRKEKIMTEAGSEGSVMVRFKHSETKEWIPIVIRLPDSEKDTKKDPKRNSHTRSPVSSLPVSPRVQVSPSPQANSEIKEKEANNGNIMDRKIYMGFSFSLSRMRPCSYWPWAMVIVLICLLFFGKTFAICCTSIWWYLVPTLNGEDESHKRRKINKDDLKRRNSGDEKMTRKIGGDLIELASPPKDDHSPNRKGKTLRTCSF